MVETKYVAELSNGSSLIVRACCLDEAWGEARDLIARHLDEEAPRIEVLSVRLFGVR